MVPAPHRNKLLSQVIVQGEGVLHTVTDVRTAIATKTLKLSRCGARDDGVGLLRSTVLEHPAALEHKRSRLASDSSHDPLEANERRRAVAAIHHKVLDLPFALDIAGERLHHTGPGESGQARTLAVGLLIPRLDGEPSIRTFLHESRPGNQVVTDRWSPPSTSNRASCRRTAVQSIRECALPVSQAAWRCESTRRNLAGTSGPAPESAATPCGSS